MVTTAGTVGLTGLGLIYRHCKKDKMKGRKSYKGVLFILATLSYAGYTAYTNVKRKVQLQDNQINKKAQNKTAALQQSLMSMQNSC